MIYLDANVFIYPVLYKGKKAKKATDILSQVVKGKKALTSCLTIDEVVWKIWIESSRDKGIKEGERLLHFPNLTLAKVKPETIFQALNLMKRYEQLKPRDAIHLATALERNITEIVSDDQDFDQIKGIKRIKLG